MTKREFMERIITGEATQDELITFAQKEIETLDKRNATRGAKLTKLQIENEAIKAKICETFTGREELTASVIGTEMKISVNKASALCRQLVAEGKMTVKEIKVPKKGTQKAYTIIE